MANKDYNITGNSADFTPLAELAVGLDYLDPTLTLGRANFPRTDSLRIGMAALCDDEFMKVIGLGPGTVAVSRGTGDTVPARHAAHSLVWFIGTDTVGTDGKEHSAEQTNGVKYSPYTVGGGALTSDSQSPDSVTYNWRFFRPYPPGQMRVRGQRWYVPQTLSSDDQNMTLTWAHRDRLLEADQLLDHDQANIGPEPGTTYTARIYDKNGNLKRTEVGIMATTHDDRGNLISPEWNYTWHQAMADLGFPEPEEVSHLVDAKMTIYATRQNFDSWQGYEINFTVDTQGKFMAVAQLAELAAQPRTPDQDPEYPPNIALYDGQLAQIVAQAPVDDGEAVVAADGMYVAQVSEGIGQQTSFYTPMNRNLFETPYARLAKLGLPPETHTVTTVVARPSDRLTDSHTIWARNDWPLGTGAILQFRQVDNPTFTPWITLGEKVDYLDTSFSIAKSSFHDGTPLNGVLRGQVCQVDAEMCRVESVSEQAIVVARGCYDTVPARHAKSARVWFFEAESGQDPTSYPQSLSGGVIGAAAQVKMVPAVYGPPLLLDDVPTDRVNMIRRTERPYPPGQVMVNNHRWYAGCIVTQNTPADISWVHRNRIAQGATVVDHLALDAGKEADQKYRLSIAVTVRPRGAPSYEVIIREEIVNDTHYRYDYDKAKLDGYRAGILLGFCGTITLAIVLESVRGELRSWQNYVIPIQIPSYTCPPGKPSGGGQLPPTNGGGNGDTGSGTPGGTTPGGYNPGDGPLDPIGDDGGDNGAGPPPQPEVPPEWEPVEIPIPDPGDPNPALAAHWDKNWDRHWDAYTKENQGD